MRFPSRSELEGGGVGLLRLHPPLVSYRKATMVVRKSGADVERQRGAIRGLLNQVPLPIRGRPNWDTLVAIIRHEDDEPGSRYSEDEKKRLHTARLLIDKAHPTQKMSSVAAREISICLSEYHEATRPLYDPKKVEDDPVRSTTHAVWRRPGVGGEDLFT